VTLLVVLLLGAVLLYAAIAYWSRRERAALGIRNGAIVAADDSALGAPTLRSERYGLVGRPDQLVRRDGKLIPVEQKPTARRAQPSHVLQVAAQCLLVQEVYGLRPPYGLLVLAGGVQTRVPFTAELEQRLLAMMEQMHSELRTDSEPGARWVAAKCQACGFNETCWG
jgi:CRISPR-associated exonuclease Cas4